MTKRLEDNLEKKANPIPSFEEVRQLSAIERPRSHCLAHELGYRNTGMLLAVLMLQPEY